MLKLWTKQGRSTSIRPSSNNKDLVSRYQLWTSFRRTEHFAKRETLITLWSISDCEQNDAKPRDHLTRNSSEDVREINYYLVISRVVERRAKVFIAQKVKIVSSVDSPTLCPPCDN